MIKTDQTTKTLLSDFKRTKMIATVGPSTNSYEQIVKMLKSGVNGFRLNFSHGTHEEKAQHIDWIRKASAEANKPVAVIQDLAGPKVRLGDFDGMISIEKGQEYCLEYKANYQESGHIPVQYDLSKKVKRGQILKIYDGKVVTYVTSVRDGKVYVKAENAGIITQRKGINAPDTDFGSDIFTAKDKKDLLFGVHLDIDYVAVSFVQSGKNIDHFRKFMKGHGYDAKLIAKVETKLGIEKIDEIIDASDGIMIARGDMAAEISLEAVPVITRQIIGKCQEKAKLSIVATQMLASMMETPEPTRAEVSDIATAVIVGSDCVMLSDETAAGKYPIEAIKIMKRVILYTQANSPLRPVFHDHKDESIQDAISDVVLALAEQVGAKAIVAETKSGRTAIGISAKRPVTPLISVTSSVRTAQQLAIVYGSKSYIRPDNAYAATKLIDWLSSRKVFQKGDIVVTASGKYPGAIGATDTIKVRMIDK